MAFVWMVEVVSRTAGAKFSQEDRKEKKLNQLNQIGVAIKILFWRTLTGQADREHAGDGTESADYHA